MTDVEPARPRPACQRLQTVGISILPGDLIKHPDHDIAPVFELAAKQQHLLKIIIFD